MTHQNHSALAVKTESMLGFGSPEQFAHLETVAIALADSALVPQQFQKSVPNCIIALEMAGRMGASPFAVMQQMYVVHGKPAWSSQFVIACINSSGKFSPLRFDLKPLGKVTVEYSYTRYEGRDKKRETGKVEVEDVSCIAWAKELETGERLESPMVTIRMAVEEGWYMKADSKWKTMSELMLRYRAATFFGRLYAPEMLMGMQTNDEVEDLGELKRANVTDVTTAAPEVKKPDFTGTTKPAKKREKGGENRTSAQDPAAGVDAQLGAPVENSVSEGSLNGAAQEAEPISTEADTSTTLPSEAHEQVDRELIKAGFDEARFVAGLKLIDDSIPATAKTIGDLSNEVIAQVLNDSVEDVIDFIIIKEAKAK